MRLCKSFSTVVLALFFTLVVPLAPPTSAVGAAERGWNGASVVGHARLAPIDRLQRDFAFLAEGVDQGATSKIRELFSELSEGLDASRPAGAALLLKDKFVPMIFLPLKDEKSLLAVLESRFGWEFEQESDGYYRSAGTADSIRFAARAVGPWFYLTGASHRELLREVPADPTVVFEGVDPTLTAHARFYVDQLPQEMRAELFSGFMEGLAGSDSQTDAAASLGVQLAGRWTQQFLGETAALEFELQCFRPLEQFHVTSRLKAVPGSRLERWIDETSVRPALFSHLASRDSLFAMIASWQLDAESVRPLSEGWASVADQMRAAVPSPRSRDQAERLIGRLVAQAVDSVSATLQQGALDGGLVVEPQGRDQVVLLAGATLRGARALEESATEVGTLLQQSAEFRALGWSMGGNGDVTIHQLTVPVSDESARNLFGDPVYLAAGVGTEKLYAALGGEETLTRLSAAIDRSRDEAPERGELLRVAARLAPLLAVLDTVPGSDAENDRSIHELATLIAPYKKNDALELAITAADRALEGRLRIDMGVVRMLASKMPAGRSSSTPADVAGPAVNELAGTLRLKAGEQFQLQFHTDSDVTTTIDGQDRIDHGVHSLTYDFRVLQVEPDGTMRIETALSRATIDKTSPEGREQFDSRTPPDPQQMTAEMLLHSVVIDQPVLLSVRPDGTIAEIAGIDEAINKIVDTRLEPSADEREQARMFVAQLLNENGLRDSLTRGFEFYAGRQVAVGDRWSRTSENLTLLNFLLDNRYQVKAVSGDEALISVRSQVRQPEAAASDPMQWEVVGSQSGTISLDPRSGRLRVAEYELRLDAEVTFEMDGRMVSRPIVSVFKMTLGEPQLVARKVVGDASASDVRAADWIELTGDAARTHWRPSRSEAWRMEGNDLVSVGGNYAKWSYCEFTERTFADFELVADVRFGPGCNGGICVRASQGGLDGVNPAGYEVQLLGIDTDRNPTGSIYKMPAGGPVEGAYSARPRLAQPNQWFSVRVVAQGTRLSVYLNDEQVAVFDDTNAPLRSGHIILQGSPEGEIRYRNVRVRPL